MTKRWKRYYQCEEITGIERKTKEFIPEAAFREAVANALAHRNWDMNSHVRISLFKDRIEIKSPGELPKGITEEEYLSGEISCLRNPVLGNVFFRMRYIEMFGTGFSKAKTIRLLNSLVEKGYVECRGNGRGTEYCLS